MKKKLLSLLLMTAMTASLLAGCGENDDKNLTDDTSKSQDDKGKDDEGQEDPGKDQVIDGEIPADYFAGTELDIAIIRRTADTTEDFNTKPIMKIVEEATGIHVNWVIIDESVKDERISTMLASNELPDAFLGLLSMDTISTNKELFYDLSKDELLETYAPKVLQDYEDGGQGALDIVTWPDGSIMSLVGNMGSSPGTEPGGIMMINQDWLKNVGMDVPTTADEFYKVLCAFRDQDANGNGNPDDEIPLTFCNKEGYGFIMNFANPWGIAGQNKKAYYKIENGVVEPILETQAFRDFLEYYHKLAKEGLLDIEGFTQTSEQHSAKKDANLVGVMSVWTPPSDLNCVVVRPFEVEGYTAVKGGDGIGYFYGSPTGLVASADCSNIEALLHWWNFLHRDTETKYIARFGEEGHTWYWDDNGIPMCYAETPEGLDPNISYTSIEHIGNNAAPYIMPQEYQEVPDERWKMVEQVYDMLYDEYVQNEFVAPEKVEERVFIETDLFTMIGDFTSNSIIEGVTDESWNQFLEDLKTYKYYEWIEWYQGQLDGEF